MIIDLTTLRGRLRRFAKVRYGSMQALADHTGINYTQLANYSDEEPPGGLTLMKLVYAGLNVHWLLAGEGVMSANLDRVDYGSSAIGLVSEAIAGQLREEGKTGGIGEIRQLAQRIVDIADDMQEHG